MTKPVLITNAQLIDPAKDEVVKGWIAFDEKILDLGEGVPVGFRDFELIDADGAHVAPGLIDMRVVIGEPGAEHKETFKSAGRAAAAGGVTTLVMMPNTTPVLDDQSLIDFVLRRGIDRSGGVRILPAAALTQHLDGELMTEIGLAEAGRALHQRRQVILARARSAARFRATSTR